MFGMSLAEIVMIAAVAVIALGPDKLPKAMYEIAKLFKVFKKTINEAQSSFEQEIKIAQLKEDAKKYKEKFTQTQDSVRKKLTFEELEELKKGVSSINQSVNDSFGEIKKELSEVKNIGLQNQNNAQSSEQTESNLQNSSGQTKSSAQNSKASRRAEFKNELQDSQNNTQENSQNSSQETEESEKSEK